MFPLKRSGKRRGVTITETAVVLPIFLLMTFALLEFGRAFMVFNLLKVSARKAARSAVTGELATDDVAQIVKNHLNDVVAASDLTIYIKDAVEFDTEEGLTTDYPDLPDIDPTDEDIELGRLFIVRAEVKFNDVALFVPQWISSDLVLAGQAMMRHEGNATDY